MVEFALALPFLTTVLFGILQYGLLYTAQMTLQGAAAAAARCAVMVGCDPTTAARGAVTPFLDGGQMGIQVTDVTVGGMSGAKQVQLTYAYPMFLPVPGSVASTFNIRARQVAR